MLGFVQRGEGSTPWPGGDAEFESGLPEAASSIADGARGVNNAVLLHRRATRRPEVWSEMRSRMWKPYSEMPTLLRRLAPHQGRSPA